MGRPSQPWYRESRGVWVTTLDGRHRTLARGPKAASRAAAMRAFHALMADRKAGASGSDLTLAALIDLFLAEVERERAPLTLESYGQRLGSLRRKYGEALAADLKPLHVGRWIAEHDWNATTRHGAITVAKRLTRWARRQGYLAVDPLADLDKPTPLPRDTDLTAGAADAIERAVGPGPFGDLLLVLRATGMRPSEAMSLTAAMLDLEAGTAHPTGKGRRRVVYLPAATTALLAGLAARHPEGPLLRNEYGRPWTRHATAQRFARLRRQLGLGAEATAESYRHMFATDALTNGVPIATVAELMGHRSTTMIAKHYSKLRKREGHLREALRRVRPDVEAVEEG